MVISRFPTQPWKSWWSGERLRQAQPLGGNATTNIETRLADMSPLGHHKTKVDGLARHAVGGFRFTPCPPASIWCFKIHSDGNIGRRHAVDEK